MQLSAIYKASDLLPQLVALVNFGLLGGHTIGESSAATESTASSSIDMCVVPLDAVDRIGLSFVTPLIALALLALVAVIQMTARAALSRSTREPEGSHSSPINSTAWRVYNELFVPAEPRGQPVLAVEQGSNGSVGPQPLMAERSEPLISDAQQAQHQAPPSSLNQSMWRSYQRSIVRLLLLSYSGLSLVALSCLHWQAVGEYGYRLTDFPTVSPGSIEWRTVFPAVLVVLVVVCSAPTAMLLFLGHQQRNGHIAEVKQKLQSLRVNSSELSTREQLLLQLTAMYRTQHWWMPAYVLMRRLLAAVLLVTVRSSSVWVWLTVVGHIQLVLHLRQQPYERAVDNDFESLTLLSLSLQTALLAAFPPPVPASMSAAMVGTTTALIAAPLLVIALYTLTRSYQRYRDGHRQQLSQQDALL